jgi:hypothetical protein
MAMQPMIGAVAAAVLGATGAAAQGEFRLQGDLAFEPRFASYAERVSQGLDAVGARNLDAAAGPTYSAFDERLTAGPVVPVGFDFSTDVPACAACGSLDGRFDIRADSDVEGLRLGALVRLGENLTEERRGLERSGWFFFAAADAQAVTWTLDRRVPLTQAMRLEEKQLVGDAQAGLAIRIAGGDLALGYVHREIKHEKATATEQFGGLTFVVRR